NSTRLRRECRLSALILPSRHLLRLVNLDRRRLSAASAASIGMLLRLTGEPPPAGGHSIHFCSSGLGLPAFPRAASVCRESVGGRLQPVAFHNCPQYSPDAARSRYYRDACRASVRCRTDLAEPAAHSDVRGIRNRTVRHRTEEAQRLTNIGG